MTVSYKKLWKLLIDKNLKKKDLIHMSGISNYTLNKLNAGKSVTTVTHFYGHYFANIYFKARQNTIKIKTYLTG